MKGMKTLEIRIERTIAAPPLEVFKAWLNPKVPGTPWEAGDALILQPKVDGLFYWLSSNTAHYGRFTKLQRSSVIQHTWMSSYTEGLESTVTVTFKKQGGDTLMTLEHTGLPDNDKGQAHVGGWHDFLDTFPMHFMKASRKKVSRKKVAGKKVAGKKK
ncbi:MAG: hypothetical protein JWP91_316 [Fibrobacteres bacterium]|nr:hypothetical protein [Fibrobacterota bacterium]